jgi:hypothetical protein
MKSKFSLRGLYWKRKAASILPYPEQKLKENKTTIKTKKKRIVLEGTEYFKFLWQKSRYLEKKRRELSELRERLPRILNALPKTKHPVLTVKQVFIECINSGKSRITANPYGPDIKMEFHENPIKPKISVQYRLRNKSNWEKPVVIEVNPLHVKTAKKIRLLETEIYNVSINRMNEETFKEIKKYDKNRVSNT